MKKYLGIVLVGAMAAFGAGCGDSNGGSGGSGGGTGGTGGTGTGGTGGDGTGGTGGGPASACAPADGVDLCDGGSGAVALPTNITEDTCLSPDCDYLVTTLHFVEGSTLTIKPGVQVLGEGSAAGNAALIITNTGKIEAIGTPDDPIVMTSALPVGQKTAGDWGGLVMLGKAKINSGTSISGAADCDGAAGDCQDFIEGLDPANPAVGERAFYGGNDDSHDCGTLNYVRVEFGGFQFSQDNETNSVTLGGCGDQTDLDYVQAHRGRDDAFEMFGGKPNLRHIIASGMDDDGIDWDQGFTGVVEYAVVDHYAGGSDDPRGFETDNIGSGQFDAEPRSAPTVQWVTAIGYPGTQQGVLNREGTRGQMSDMIVTNFGTLGYDMRDNGWDGAWPMEFFVEDSCFWNNATNFPDDDNDPSLDSSTFFDEPTELLLPALNNSETEDPGLTSDAFVGVDGGQPNYIGTNTNCAGAFPDGTDWTLPWSAHPEE